MIVYKLIYLRGKGMKKFTNLDLGITIYYFISKI